MIFKVIFIFIFCFIMLIYGELFFVLLFQQVHLNTLTNFSFPSNHTRRLYIYIYMIYIKIDTIKQNIRSKMIEPD